MTHLRAVSRSPLPASEGQTSVLETAIIVIMSVFFRDWDNFTSVIRNLQKYYSKTP